jgi:iron-sulfur cluster assembly protein
LSELPFHITPSAFNELNSILISKKIPEGYGVRIGIKGSGCAGVSYVIGFDQPTIDDKTYKKDLVSFIIAKKHLLYISGLHVDFIDSIEERGFIFEHASF